MKTGTHQVAGSLVLVLPSGREHRRPWLLRSLAVPLTLFGMHLALAPIGRVAAQPLGQTTLPATAVPAARSIEVRVIDDATEKPIPGVAVASQFNPAPTPEKQHLAEIIPRTDDSGRIRIDIPAWLPTPMFFLTILASNHPPRNIVWSVATGANVRDLLPASYTVRLTPPKTVGGWVRDSKGNAVAEAEVVVWGSDSDEGRNPGAGLQVDDRPYLPRDRGQLVRTDASGRWMFHQYPPSIRALSVDVTRPSGGIRTFTTPQGNQFVLHAGTPQVNYFGLHSAVPIELNALLATNAVLVLKDGFTVKGVVNDAQGKPVPGAVVQEQIGMDLGFLPTPITNEPDGRFELRDRSYPRALLLVHAPGYAMALKSIQPAPDLGDVAIQLEPANPARIRVIDAGGNPIRGVGVMLVPHRSSVPVQWSGKTESDGRAVWSNAPLQELVFWIFSNNRSGRRAVRWRPDGQERVVRLDAETNSIVRLKIRAIDEDSGQPLPTFVVKRRQDVGSSVAVWGEGQHGEFVGELNPGGFSRGSEERFLVEIEAPGRMPWKSALFYADEGDQQIVARLAEAKPIVGRVLDPAGKPASRAILVVNTQDWGLFSHQPGQFQFSQGGLTAKSDEEGRFQLSPQPEDRWVVVTHSSGIASLRLSELRRVSTITLQAWGRVEGVLLVDGKPGKSLSVSVRTPLDREGSIPYQASYSHNTDSNGRFVFTNLPPGSYVWYRQPMVIMGAMVVESHPLPFDLKPGETRVLEFPKGGRLVQGSVQTTKEVDWHNDMQILQLKGSAPPEEPAFQSFSSMNEFEQARNGYRRSPERLEHLRKARQYQLEMETSGDFKIPDVLPGTYILTLRSTRPPARGQYRQYNAEVLGSLEKEVVIPPGQGPLDLGLFEMEVKDAETQTSAAIEFSAVSLDGKPLALASLRGKPIVLTFWAEWTLEGAEHLKRVDAARRELEGTGDLTFLAVNLDEDVAAAIKGAAGLGREWIQARLEGRSRLAITEQLGVSTLPMTFVLDARGRVVVRNLVAERLKSGLARAQKATVTK